MPPPTICIWRPDSPKILPINSEFNKFKAYARLRHHKKFMNKVCSDQLTARSIAKKFCPNSLDSAKKCGWSKLLYPPRAWFISMTLQPSHCSVADSGFGEGGFYYRGVRESLEATPTFGKNHAHFDRLERNFQPYQSNRSVFERILKLKHAKVSHNSSFLSSVSREGGSI
jgi:hypothetical protein